MKITSRRTTRPLSDPQAAKYGSIRESQQPQQGEVSSPDIQNQNLPSQTNQQNQVPKTTQSQQQKQDKYVKTNRKLEESEKEASKILQDLASKKLTNLRSQDVSPGNLVYFQYKAKGAENDPEFVYDKTPFSFFLQSHQSTSSSSKILGINLHWLPKVLRKTIMNAIIKIGRNDIKRGKIPIIQYRELKPVLQNTGAIYAVRLYIKNRISQRGIVVPPEYFIKTAESVPPEQITNGYSAEQIFAMAIKRAKSTKRKQGSRYKRTL
jgi:hypothetical protein